MTTPSRRSSYSSSLRDRFRGHELLFALWGLVAVAGVVLIVLLLHDRKGPRDDVAAYIRRVNAVSTASAKDYKAIELAYRKFTLSPTKAGVGEDRALRRAAAELTALRARMARIPAPPQAAALRTKLIAFFRQQEAVSRELIGVTTYVPRLAAAEQPLGPAATTMRTALKQGKTAKEQTAALDAYAAELRHATRAVAAIHAPALFAVSHRQQVSRLARAATLVHRLAAALAANDRKALKQTVNELSSGGGDGGQQAVRTAILSYDRRVKRIRTLAAAVERERVRLDKNLD